MTSILPIGLIFSERVMTSPLPTPPQQVALQVRVRLTDITMLHSRQYEDEDSDDQEERILAMLGIIGTVLNLLVVIFVYIYTTI